MSEWIDDPDVNFDKQRVRCGHSHDDDEGWAMLEFHVDASELILTKHRADMNLVEP